MISTIFGTCGTLSGPAVRGKRRIQGGGANGGPWPPPKKPKLYAPPKKRKEKKRKRKKGGKRETKTKTPQLYAPSLCS